MTDKPKVESGSGPRAIMRVLRLFEVLSGAPDGLTLSDLSGRLNEPKSTLLNSLRALEADGFLNLDGLQYQLGPRAFRLATQITSGWSLRRVMRNHLRHLADRAQETALLSVLDTGLRRSVHIDTIEGQNRIRYVLNIGSGGPLYATAAGRVLLAFQPREYRDTYVEAVRMEPITSATTVDRDVLRAQLDEVRRKRFWVSRGEVNEDGGAIAAPVFGPDGKITCALSVALPLTRLAAREAELTAIVTDVAGRASGCLGDQRAETPGRGAPLELSE